MCAQCTSIEREYISIPRTVSTRVRAPIRVSALESRIGRVPGDLRYDDLGDSLGLNGGDGLSRDGILGTHAS
jgi:hypothetical protein